MLEPRRGRWLRYPAVLLAAAAGVGILTASMLTGDSVRSALVSILDRSTGKASYAITAPRFFSESLGAEIARAGAWNWCPVIVLDGWIAGSGGSARTVPVTVFGIDSRFFSFHGRSLPAPTGTEAYVSPQLTATLGVLDRTTIALRFAKPSPVPADWLFGPKVSQAITHQVTIAGTRSADDLGNFSLNPNQAPGASIFVPLALLQEELKQPDGVNTVLISTSGRRHESSALAQALRERAGPEDLGIRIEEPDGSLVAIEADSLVMPDALVHDITAALAKLDVVARPISSYLALSIVAGLKSAPYSFVAALDPSMMPVEDGSVVLNDWTARELAARPGDAIQLTIPIWDRGTLTQNTASFRLDRVVPMRGTADDPDLTPELPGIAGAETMSAWRVPFPLDRTLIHANDEAYWKRYGAVPKAFISPAAAAKLWGGRLGYVTSIRADLRSPMTTGENMLASLRAAVRTETDPLKLGYWIRPLRTAKFDTARMPAGLFLYCAALPVTASFALLFVLLRGVVVRTAIVLSVAGTVGGVAVAPRFSALMLEAVLRWWPEVIGGVPVAVHPSLTWMAWGGAAGLGIACFCTVLAWWRSRREPGWRFAAALLAAAVFLPVAAARFRVPPAAPRVYNVIAEASAPVILNPSDGSNRRALGLPDATWYALRLQPGEDVSRRNLSRPQNPSVAGAPKAFIDAMLRRPGWAGLNTDLPDGSVPAIADRFSLAAVLHGQVGDTVVLNPAADQPVRLRITGTMREPALQNLLIINETDLLRAFPSSNGYRLLLAQAARPKDVAKSAAAALADYGVTAQTVSNRISSYHAVDDAYVSAFQTLGALAFLIGSVAFGIQARRAAAFSARPLRFVIGRTALSISAGILVAVAVLVPALLSGLLYENLVLWVPALAGAGAVLSLAAAAVTSLDARKPEADAVITAGRVKE